MKKQFIFILIFLLFPTVNIYPGSLNITGDTIVQPADHNLLSYSYYAQGVGENEAVIWEVTNGIFNIHTSIEEECTAGTCYGYGPISHHQVAWSNVAGKGSIKYTVRSNPARWGYADIEILSVNNSPVDSIKVGNFYISSDTIYIPKGESGLVKCSAYMIYPACKGGSETPVTNFRWQFPPSLGDRFVTTGGEFYIAFDAQSGDGEEITVMPYVYENGGKPRTYTIQRTEGVIENRNIDENTSFNWDSFIVKNVNIFSGANVSIHGDNSVWLLPQFYAYPGSYVNITAGTNNNNTYQIKDVKKTTTKSGNIFEKTPEGFSQNYPNPCYENTKMDYFLSENIREVSLHIVSSTGQVVRNFSINERGSGVFNLDVSGLPSGIYLYYVVADGKMLGSKRMIVSGR